MSRWPAITWAICGGSPLMIASVMNSLRKSWGVNRNGSPVDGSVRPVRTNAAARMSRTTSGLILRRSAPNRRWNSSGDGGQPHAFLPVVGGDQWDLAGVIADPVDDRAEHIRQFRRDQQESLLVGLGWQDLQQRHDFVGGGQTVLHEAVVREFQQLLSPDTGGPRDFNDRPGPEGVVFFEFEVASLAGAAVVGPDLAGDGCVTGGGADQRLPGCGERLSRPGLAGCL